MNTKYKYALVMGAGFALGALCVIDYHPRRWLHRLRRHTLERSAEVPGLVTTRRDEQVASRGVHAEKLIRGGRRTGRNLRLRPWQSRVGGEVSQSRSLDLVAGRDGVRREQGSKLPLAGLFQSLLRYLATER